MLASNAGFGGLLSYISEKSFLQALTLLEESADLISHKAHKATEMSSQKRL